MTKLPILLAASLGLSLAAPLAQAQTTVTAYGNTPTTGSTGYTTGSVNPSFQRTATALAANSGDYRNTFSDSSALNPSSGYTGPTFYGGYEIITNLTTNTGIIGSQRVRDASPDGIQISGAGSVTWSSTTTTASLAGFLVFQQADWSALNTGGVNISQLGGSFNMATSNASYNNAFESRWVVQSGGNYYVSEAAITANLGGVTTGTQDVATTNWALVDPSVNLNLILSGVGAIDYSISGTAMASNNISSVGLYFEADNFNGSDASAIQWTFQLNSLGFEGTAAIPEPSTYAALAGACMLLAASARRRKHAKN